MALSTLKTLLVAVLAGFALTTQAKTQLHGFDLEGSLVPIDEIKLGGPPRDGIPAIDRPVLVGTDEASFLTADDRVLGLVHKGEARAYPIKIMDWHEVVNDRIAGDSVAITYCPLCFTGIAFDSGSNAPRTFGVSGLLYNSNVLLYDRETESLWSQLAMQAVTGQEKGKRLEAIPLQHTTWAAWQEKHPDTKVLSLDTGFRRDYERNPYTGYATSSELYFPLSASSPRFHPKEQVLGLEINGQFKAYPFTELAELESGEISDSVGKTPVTIRFDAESRSAVAFDSDGNELPGVTSFWFAWYAFNPETAIFEVD